MKATLLYIYCLVAALIPCVCLSVTEPLPLWGRVTGVVLPFGVYMLILASTQRIGRSVWWMFPILFIAAFQIVLLKLYGGSVIAVDMFLNVATTNPNEAGELLGSMLPIVAVVVVIYLPLLIWGGVAWSRRLDLTALFRRRALIAGAVVSLAGLVTLAGACASKRPVYTVAENLFPVNAFYNLVLAFKRTSDIAAYHTTSAAFTAGASSTRPADERELVILVVGETSRAENWQLCGYRRPTNPRLSRREGLTMYHRAVSESNTTHKAVPLLLSDLTAFNFGDSINLRKGIITPFREAGFHTTYLSNQGRNHSYIDFFGSEADDVRFLRDSLTAAEMLHPITDLSLLPVLAEHLAEPKAVKELIVIHTYGSHFSYVDRYPDRCRRFTPDAYTRSSAEQREALVNAYDNAIVATDLLLDSIISLAAGRGVPAVMLYTSDHGEDIFDDSRERFLHASPTPTFHQLHVPFLVWTSEEFSARHPELTDALAASAGKRVSSSEAFYHTALQLGGLTARTFRPDQSLASESYVEPTERYYLTDHNRAKPLVDAGFTPIDIDLLTRLDR